jgi:hypothetical protein
MKLTQMLSAPVLATLVLTTSTPSAQAAVNPTGHGALCSLDTSGVTGQGDIQSGLLGGGPFAAYDANNPTYLTPDPYVVCSIQVGGTGMHSDADAAQALFWETGWVGWLPPTTVSFAAASSETVFVCSEIWIATSDGHFSIYYDEEEQRFTLNPNVACQIATVAQVPVGTGIGGPSFHAPPRVVALNLQAQQ